MLAYLAFDVARMGHDIVQAVVLFQPFHRGFRAHFVHAWHIIDFVAD